MGSDPRELTIPGIEYNSRNMIKWPPEHVADKQLTLLLKKARAAGDEFRAQAYDAEIKRRKTRRDGLAFRRADVDNVMKLLTEVYQLHRDQLPEELSDRLRAKLVEHGIIPNL